MALHALDHLTSYVHLMMSYVHLMIILSLFYDPLKFIL